MSQGLGSITGTVAIAALRLSPDCACITFDFPVALHSVSILMISARVRVGSGARTMPSVRANSTPAAKQSSWLTAAASQVAELVHVGY